MPAAAQLSRYCLTCFGLLAMLTLPARADVFSPAYLQLTELSAGEWEVTWRIPASGAGGAPPELLLPANWETLTPPARRRSGNYFSSHWRVTTDGAIDGEEIRFRGLQGAVSDVVVRVEHSGGAEAVSRLGPDAESLVLQGAADALSVAGTYFVLGVEHILLGPDHLLFVLALLLIVNGWRQLLLTVTAFTLAHSITLVAASLNWLVVPIAPVEAIIALSIVFVASEALHGLQGRAGLTARMPWLVALLFGLLHGLGFASALSEIGLPEQALVPALLMFNVGVEAGQLLFVGAALCVAELSQRVAPRQLPAARGMIAYGIGGLAAFWTIERVAFGVLAL